MYSGLCICKWCLWSRNLSEMSATFYFRLLNLTQFGLYVRGICWERIEWGVGIVPPFCISKRICLCGELQHFFFLLLSWYLHVQDICKSQKQLSLCTFSTTFSSCLLVSLGTTSKAFSFIYILVCMYMYTHMVLQ